MCKGSLIDIDCDGVIISRKFIDKEDFTASMGYQMAVDQLQKEAPNAEIKNERITFY